VKGYVTYLIVFLFIIIMLVLLHIDVMQQQMLNNKKLFKQEILFYKGLHDIEGLRASAAFGALTGVSLLVGTSVLTKNIDSLNPENLKKSMIIGAIIGMDTYGTDAKANVLCGTKESIPSQLSAISWINNETEEGDTISYSLNSLLCLNSVDANLNLNTTGNNSTTLNIELILGKEIMENNKFSEIRFIDYITDDKDIGYAFMIPKKIILLNVNSTNISSFIIPNNRFRVYFSSLKNKLNETEEH